VKKLLEATKSIYDQRLRPKIVCEMLAKHRNSVYNAKYQRMNGEVVSHTALVS